MQAEVVANVQEMTQLYDNCRKMNQLSEEIQSTSLAILDGVKEEQWKKSQEQDERAFREYK